MVSGWWVVVGQWWGHFDNGEWVVGGGGSVVGAPR